MKKRCSKCNEEKGLEAFYPKDRKIKYPNSFAGYSSQCRECLKKKQILWRKNNPESAKNVDLKQCFGITLREYNAMFENQDGKCAICKTHQSELVKTLAVDHCHESGNIRGLLCQRCNHGIGNFRDDAELLNKAIQYLKVFSNNQPEVAEYNTTVVPIKGTS